MTNLQKMALSYRESAALLRERAAFLRLVIRTQHPGAMEQMRLRRRIDTLGTMSREAEQVAAYLEHYYDPGHKQSEAFCV